VNPTFALSFFFSSYLFSFFGLDNKGIPEMKGEKKQDARSKNFEIYLINQTGNGCKN